MESKYFLNVSEADSLLDELKNENINNIVIFISDATRWDHLPIEVREMGVTFKMVAASTFTAPSVSSLITGLYPFRHNVFSFHDVIPPHCVNLLKLPGYNGSFWTENTWLNWDFTSTTPIYRMMRIKERISLEDIKEPFIYVEDEKGGHCPYGWDYEDDYKEWECIKFFSDFGKKDIALLRERYKMGVDRSLREFKKRISILKKRNILEKTLIIFLADHGELLGEYGGIVGHSNISTPEIIYVPCVFIHPSLKKGTTLEEKGVISHVDILPTIIDLLKIKTSQNFDGQSILKMKKLSKFKLSFFTLTLRRNLFLIRRFSMEEKGIWSRKGGFVLRENEGFIKLTIRAIYELFLSKSIQSSYIISRFLRHPIITICNSFKMIEYLNRRKMNFNSISLTEDEIREIISIIEEKKIHYDVKFHLSNKIKTLKKI